jgi:TolA-binding protein
MNRIHACRLPLLAVWLLVTALLAAAVPAEEGGGSSDAARAAYAAAAALQNRGAWELAAEEWEAFLEAHPQDPLAAKARYYMGLCLVEDDRRERAADIFRQVLASTADAGTLVLARWELARLAFQAAEAKPSPGAFTTAAHSLAEFLEHAPAQPQAADALFFLGESLWQSGKRDEAIAAWSRFVREHDTAPRLPETLYALGVGQAETGSRDEAAATLARFAGSFPGHALAADVAIWRADLAPAGTNPAEVEKLLVPVIDGQGPRAADALERLATSRWNAKDWPAAAQAFSRLAERFPDSPRAAHAMLSAGIAFAEAQRPDDARGLLDKVAALDTPEAAEAAQRLAALEIAAGQPARAVAIVKRALARLPAGGGQADAAGRNVAARLALARADALRELPDGAGRAEAATAYAGIARDHPGEPVAKTAGSMAALTLLELGKPQEALAQADRFLVDYADGTAVAADSAVADVRAIRAEALLASGDAAAAAAAYRDLVARAAGTNATPPAQLARWRLRQGVALVAARQWAAAHDALAAAWAGLEGDPAAEAAYLDATALVELKKPADAVPLLTAVDRDHGKWPRREDALLLLVRARREAGDTAGALAAAERLVAEFPAGRLGDAAWYRLGQTRQDAGRHDAAIEAFEKAVSLQPQGPRAAWSLLAAGWCHEAAGRLDQAARSWTRLLDGHPDSAAVVPALLARADARQRLADCAGGLADARAALARTAGDERSDAACEALLLEGLCLSGLKQPADATQAFRKLLDARPDFAAADRALFELGAALSLAGRRDDALHTFADFVKRFPDSAYAADAWFELGEQEWSAGHIDAAADAYRAAIDRADAGPGAGVGAGAVLEQARHKLAWTFVSRGDHAMAARAFADQLARHPDGPLAADAQAMRGESLFKAGDLDEAAAAFQAALADPMRLPSADLRGLAFVRAAEIAASREQWAESAALADRLVALEPASPQAAQARYAAAWARQNLGRLDDALAGYRAVADAGRTEIAARARLMEGEVLFEQEKHKDAIKAFFKVAYGFGEKAAPAAFHPWQAQATFEAARCFEVLGQPDKARGLYAELVDRYPESPQAPTARKRLASLGASNR